MKKIAIALILVTSFFTCSNDDDSNNSNGPNARDLTVLASDNTTLFQYDVLNNAETVTETNLTSTLGVPFNFSYSEAQPTLISFYNNVFNPLPIEIFQKNIISSETYVSADFCPLDNEFSLAITSDENRILQLTADGNNNLLSIRAFDKQTEDCIEIPIGEGFVFSSRTTLLLQDDLLFVFFTNSNNEYRLVSVNLNTNQVENEIVSDALFRATVNGNELLVFKSFDLEVYNTSTFELVRSQTLNVIAANDVGLFKTTFYQDEMLVLIPYPAPSFIANGPGTLNLTTGDYQRGDNGYLFDIEQELTSEFIDNNGVSFRSYAANIETNEVIIGFSLNNPATKGGIAYCDFEGNINKIVELDAFPFSIITR